MANLEPLWTLVGVVIGSASTTVTTIYNSRRSDRIATRRLNEDRERQWRGPAAQVYAEARAASSGLTLLNSSDDSPEAIAREREVEAETRRARSELDRLAALCTNERVAELATEVAGLLPDFFRKWYTYRLLFRSSVQDEKKSRHLDRLEKDFEELGGRLHMHGGLFDQLRDTIRGSQTI